MYNPASFSQEEHRNRAQSIHYTRYLVIFQIIDNLDEKHLRRAGNPRLYDHPYRSAQLFLWPEGAVEWYLILRLLPMRSAHGVKRVVWFSSKSH
jgi:hypothetical protein